MRIVVSDEHPVVVMGVRVLLKDQLNCQVVADAYSGKQLLAALAASSCDLCVTTYFAPGEQGAVYGLSLLRQLRKNYPRLRIVVLTMAINPTLVRGMFDAGADAVVNKTSALNELISAVHAVRIGRRYLSESIRSCAAECDSTTSLDQPRVKLTLSPREVEVVHWLARGMSVSEVAKQTSRSVKTISQQKHNAMRKLGLDRDTHLYEYACAVGL